MASGAARLCAAEDWRHVCHLQEGHHGPHACTAPGDEFAAKYGRCDFTWPNENELTPCPSNEVAVLGVLEPNGARVRCGLLEAHRGPHRFVIEWGSDSGGRENAKSADPE